MKEPKRVTVIVDPSTHRAAKVKAAQERTTISDKIRELLAAWLKSQNAGN